MPTLITGLVKSLALLISTFTLYHFNSIYYQSKPPHYRRSSMSSTVFTSDTLPEDERLMATIGNGYLATSIYSDSVFLSGVYNGRRREPSHRARVPSTVAIRMSIEDGAATANASYSLDVGKGLFTHRVEGRGFCAEQMIYAHRKLPNLLVVEVRVRNEQDKALKIVLSEKRSNKSEDLDLTEVPQSKLPPDIPNLQAKYGFITTTEEKKSERVGVALAWRKVPESLIIQPRTNQTFHYVTAIVSTLNSVGYLESAFSCYQEAMMLAKDDGLLAAHTEAWAELWRQSGIEVEGDLNLAQAVHGSLYYILR